MGHVRGCKQQTVNENARGPRNCFWKVHKQSLRMESSDQSLIYQIGIPTWKAGYPHISLLVGSLTIPPDADHPPDAGHLQRRDTRLDLPCVHSHTEQWL